MQTHCNVTNISMCNGDKYKGFKSEHFAVYTRLAKSQNTYFSFNSYNI